MSRIIRIGLIAIGLMVVFCGSAALGTNAQVGPIGEILKRMDDHYQKLTSLRASVKMDKFNSQLGEHDITEGTTIYIPQKGRDALVRVDWTKPVQESLAVVNKQYVLYRPKLGQAIVGKVDSAKGNGKAGNAMAFMNMSRAQLKANYTINYIGLESVSGGTQSWHLELIPKIATSYKTAELWVDGDGMPIQAKVNENNNDSTTVLLSNLEKNKTINTAEIPIKLPKGTKIIQG